MNTVHLVSRAKVNLTLEVSARRPDGYHDIDSVAQIIDIKDELFISKAPEGSIEVDVDAKDVPSGKANLVYAACVEFFEAAGILAGARCALTKRIPAGAGLGGGSGNVAAAVVGLDQLYRTGLPIEQLGHIAASVSSDAALFIRAGTVRMRGRGEIVEPLPDAPELHLVVVKPDVGVSTTWAYAHLDKSGPRAPSGASDRAENAIRSSDRAALIDSLYNDFDRALTDSQEQIRRAGQALTDRGAISALLAGSGSAVFGVFASEHDARGAARALEQDFSTVFATHTLTRRESLISGDSNEQG